MYLWHKFQSAMKKKLSSIPDLYPHNSFRNAFYAHLLIWTCKLKKIMLGSSWSLETLEKPLANYRVLLRSSAVWRTMGLRKPWKRLGRQQEALDHPLRCAVAICTHFHGARPSYLCSLSCVWRLFGQGLSFCQLNHKAEETHAKKNYIP